MANPHKGEVEFTADGKTYTLRMSIDAICELEVASGKSIVALSTELSDPSKMSMGLLRKVLWAALRDRHPDVDLKAAGELIVAAGGMMVMFGHLGKALQVAFPTEGDGADPDPQPPGQVGTGSAS